MGENELLDRALKLAEELSQTTIKLKETELRLGDEQDECNRLRHSLSEREKDFEFYTSENNKTISKLMDEIFILKGEKSQTPIIMEDNRPNTAIIIVVYNTSRFIKKQVELIRKFHNGAVDIVIVDNSFDPEVVDAIKYYNDTELKCKYLKTNASSRNGSDSHSFSLNLSYLTFKDDYEYIMYLDHDAFPTMPFCVKELIGDKVMVGMGQRRGDLEYFWPGCVCWNNSIIDRSLIDFSTSHELGLDTGGLLHRIIDKYGKDKTGFFNEMHVQNPDFNKSMYNFYSIINDGMFWHWISGSNWNKEGDLYYEERINSLMNILDKKTNS